MPGPKVCDSRLKSMAVRENGVSSVEGLIQSQNYRVEGFKEVLNRSPMIPRDASVSDSHTPDRCFFSRLVLVVIFVLGSSLFSTIYLCVVIYIYICIYLYIYNIYI